MLTEREHDLLIALKNLVDATIMIPVDLSQAHAKECCAKARAAVDHARALIKRIEV